MIDYKSKELEEWLLEQSNICSMVGNNTDFYLKAYKKLKQQTDLENRITELNDELKIERKICNFWQDRYERLRELVVLYNCDDVVMSEEDLDK